MERNVARYTDEGIYIDDDETNPRKWNCAVCHTVFDAAGVENHIASEVHKKKKADFFAHSHYCYVEINGKEVKLDNHVIFPKTMFGPKYQLFDETTGQFCSVDRFGSVRLDHNHSYILISDF